MINGSANPSAAASAAISPGIHPSQRAGTRIVAERGFAGHGATLLALDASRSDPNAPLSGDAIVAMVPDYSQPRVAHPSNGVTRAGITEVVSLPMVESSTSGDNPATLPGGRVWDIAATSLYDSNGSDPDSCLARLFFHSATPTNTELSVGLVPAYFPPSKNRRIKDLNKREECIRRLKLLVRHPALKLRMISPHPLSQRSIGYSLANNPRGNCRAQPCLSPQAVSKESLATRSRGELVALELALLFTQTLDDLDQAVLTLPARTIEHLLEISALILGPQLQKSRRAFPCGYSRLKSPHYRRWSLNT